MTQVANPEVEKSLVNVATILNKEKNEMKRTNSEENQDKKGSKTKEDTSSNESTPKRKKSFFGSFRREKMKSKNLGPISLDSPEPTRSSNSLPNTLHYPKRELEKRKSFLSEKPKGKIFKVPLTTLMEYQKESHPQLEIPEFLDLLLDAIINNGGKTKPLLFKKHSSPQEVLKHKMILETGTLDLSLVDAYILASLLLLWLEELPDPLIPNELYSECIATSQPHQIQTLLEKIPTVNLFVIKKLVSFFQEFTTPDVIEVTQIGVNNIVKLFTPFFLRTEEKKENLEALAFNTEHEYSFVKYLIQYLDKSQIAPPNIPPPF